MNRGKKCITSLSHGTTSALIDNSWLQDLQYAQSVRKGVM